MLPGTDEWLGCEEKLRKPKKEDTEDVYIYIYICNRAQAETLTGRGRHDGVWFQKVPRYKHSTSGLCLITLWTLRHVMVRSHAIPPDSFCMVSLGDSSQFSPPGRTASSQKPAVCFQEGDV